MKQFKKALVVTLCVLCLTCLAFCVTACNPNSVDGKSAYQIWLDNGNTGTEADFLTWLKGKDGTNGTDGKDGANGADGKDGANGKDGVDGKSAYQIWLDNGNTGTETDFLNWLKGKDGKDGTNGVDGKDGANGQDGKDGVNGQDGVDGKDGNGVKSAAINDKGELIITLDDGTVINAGQVVAPEKRIDENNQIICKTFEKTGKTIYGKVSNDTETFYFTDEIELKGGASYSVYKDFDCANEIASKTVKLEVGDNTFYILEKCGSDSKFYTVTIRRREIYTVTFAISDGTPIENNTVKIEEDNIIPEDYIPVITRDGYGLVWDFDFTKPVTKNTNIVATWTAIYNLSANSIRGLTDYGKTLSSLNIPNEIDGNKIIGIGSEAFNNCLGLKSVTIPDGLTSIGARAFCGCNGLTSVTIGNSVTSIGDYAFSGCADLTSVTIPDSVTSIGDGTFYNCSGLTRITIPNGVTSIGDYAFFDCAGLTSVIIPDSVTSIGDFAFYDCSGLTSVTIGSGVTSIGKYAFLGCTGLTSATIPNNVTSIGHQAFWGCSGLTSVTIGNSVTSIGSSAFDGCSGLKTVFYKGSAEQWSKISIDSYNGYLKNATRYYYSETEPALNAEGTAYDGNFWHYDTDGITPVIWKKKN